MLRDADAPLCFARVWDLRQEIIDHPEKTDTKKRFLEVINAERECSEFCEWDQGFTPKEHAEMIRAETIREATERQQREMREWQAEQKHLDAERQDKQKEADRKWQQQQEEERRKWQEQQEAERRRFQLRTALIGPVLGALLALMGWVGSQVLMPSHNINQETHAPIPTGTGAGRK